MAKITKRKQKILELMESIEQPANSAEAIKKLKEVAKAISKFDETMEVHMRLGINVKHAEQQVRSTTILPAGTGKVVRVCVVAKGEKVKEALDAGADFAGTEDIVDKISGGWLEFDTLIATPDCMALLGKLGKVLGPKGLMPNPKTGTVTPDVAKAVSDAKAGKVEYRADKQGMVHVPIGKLSFTEEDLMKNFMTLTDAVIKSKPSVAKGTYLKSVYLATTMGPGIQIDAKNLAQEAKEFVS